MTDGPPTNEQLPTPGLASSRLTKRTVFLLLAVPDLLLLLAGSRTWVTGQTTDPVLGQATVSVTGSQAAPGVLALGAVALAGVLAVFTGGPRLRRISAVILALAAIGATVLSVLVVADPKSALGRQAAEQLGRTGAVGSDASLTVWPWLAVLFGVLLTVAAVLTTVAVGRWEGLSSRFDNPATAETSDRRGARRSTWDDLSDGHDPTEDAGDDPGVDRT